MTESTCSQAFIVYSDLQILLNKQSQGSLSVQIYKLSGIVGVKSQLLHDLDKPKS